MADDTLQLECGNGKHIAWFDATHCRCGAVTLQDADHAIAAPVADDTPTVEQCRNTVILCARQLTNYPTIEMAADALIAAVRAETTEEITHQLMFGRPSPELLARLKPR